MNRQAVEHAKLYRFAGDRHAQGVDHVLDRDLDEIGLAKDLPVDVQTIWIHAMQGFAFIVNGLDVETNLNQLHMHNSPHEFEVGTPSADAATGGTRMSFSCDGSLDEETNWP